MIFHYVSIWNKLPRQFEFRALPIGSNAIKKVLTWAWSNIIEKDIRTIK